MSTNRQLLAALGLAIAVLAIGLRESIANNKEPFLLAQARLSNAPGAPVASNLSEPLEPEREVRAGFDWSREPRSFDEELARLPFVEELTRLVGGMSGAVELGGDGTDRVTDPQADWQMLERTDSILRSSGISRLAERLAGDGLRGTAGN
jgi:hypothetical protein